MSDQPNQHPRRLPPAVRGRAQDTSRDALIIGAALELLGERGYHGLTMTDVAVHAGVSKATLYRRWKVKADLVADAIATLGSLNPPRYPGTSLRDDLLALMEQAGNCNNRPEIVTATFEMARSQPDLYRILSERFSLFVRTELAKLAARAGDVGNQPLSSVQLDVLGDTVVALLAHYAGPSGTAVQQERLISFVDNVVLVLMTGKHSGE